MASVGAEAPWLISTAESCTGGLLGALITSVAGSSSIYAGGVIAYSNASKIRDLGVSETLLEKTGAVSREVAEAMAEGVRQRFGTSLGLGITGVAGPGASENKPAGLIYVALAREGRAHSLRLEGDEGREANRLRAVETALEMMLETIQGRGKSVQT